MGRMYGIDSELLFWRNAQCAAGKHVARQTEKRLVVV